MRFLKTYETFSSLISDNEYLDNLEDLKLNTDWDDERTKEDLDYYLSGLEKLQKEGGLIYRLVWLFDENDLDKDDLGYHWNLDGDFSNFYGNLENIESNDDGNERKPYLIIAKIKPYNILIDVSLSYYTELPNELEVNIKEDPTEYKLIPFELYKDYSTITL